MVFKHLKLNKQLDNWEFDKIYPGSIRMISDKQWTSVDIAVSAALFLVTDKNTRVLDIGSGVGKFCLIGATITDAYFTGVEQRKELVDITNEIIDIYDIPNIKIIHSNIVDIEFSNYDAFYFFNPFQENIDVSARIDNQVGMSDYLYDKYSNYVYKQLSLAKNGTRLVTYFGSENKVPDCYRLKETKHDNELKFWIKNDV